MVYPQMPLVASRLTPARALDLANQAGSGVNLHVPEFGRYGAVEVTESRARRRAFGPA